MLTFARCTSDGVRTLVRAALLLGKLSPCVVESRPWVSESGSARSGTITSTTLYTGKACTEGGAEGRCQRAACAV